MPQQMEKRLKKKERKALCQQVERGLLILHNAQGSSFNHTNEQNVIRLIPEGRLRGAGTDGPSAGRSLALGQLFWGSCQQEQGPRCKALAPSGTWDLFGPPQ